MTCPDIIPRDFYVYALFREDGRTPFYIGKGRGKRMYIHERDAPRFTSHKDRIIQNMLAAGSLSIPKAKLVDGLTDDEAKQVEKDLIRLVGRWPSGPLANMTDGGDGVSNLPPESTARKIAATMRAWADPEKKQKRLDNMKAGMMAVGLRFEGRKRRITSTPEISRAKKRAAMKRIWADPDVRLRRSVASAKSQSQPDYIKKRSAIARQIWQREGVRTKILQARKAYRAANPMSPEERKRLAERLNRPEVILKRLATSRAPDVRERRIAAQKAAFSTPEAKAKRSAASKKAWAARRAQYALPSANEQESQSPNKVPPPPITPQPSPSRRP